MTSLLLFIVSKEIQTRGSDGHDPCEDALAALDLVLHQLGKGSSLTDGYS